MVGAWHGHGMASANQTRPHCVNKMGKTHSKPLAVRHGRGTAWARHGNGMLCVNRPLRLPDFLNYLFSHTDILVYPLQQFQEHRASINFISLVCVCVCVCVCVRAQEEHSTRIRRTPDKLRQVL